MPVTRRPPTDPELVAGVRAGDPRAQEELVRRHQRALQATARRLLGGDHHAAEEVVQEALVRALAALARDPERPVVLGAWLAVIVRNACLDRLRRAGHGRTVSLEAVGELRAGRASEPSAVLERRETFGAVLGGLRALPARQRAALVLHELEGRSHEEIAADLAIGVGASKALVCRARRGVAHLREAA